MIFQEAELQSGSDRLWQFLALDDAGLAGTLCLKVVDERSTLLWMVWLRPAVRTTLRGGKILKRLFKWADEKAMEIGRSVIYGRCRRDNKGARRLYEKLGFKVYHSAGENEDRVKYLNEA